MKNIIFLILVMVLSTNKAIAQKPSDVSIYNVDSGETLKNVIERWCEPFSIDLVWHVIENDNELDWIISHEITIEGSLYDSVGKLLDSYDHVLSWKFYKNNVLNVWLEEK